MLITLQNNCVYILELTIGYESNLKNSATREREKSEHLIKEQQKHYQKVKFVNISITSLGVFSESSLGLIHIIRFDSYH